MFCLFDAVLVIVVVVVAVVFIYYYFIIIIIFISALPIELLVGILGGKRPYNLVYKLASLSFSIFYSMFSRFWTFPYCTCSLL